MSILSRNQGSARLPIGPAAWIATGHLDRDRPPGSRKVSRPADSAGTVSGTHREIGLAPPMGTNHLLLLIACLAILVALGILTG